MSFLRSSTGITIIAGPFVDKADGFTPLTTLTVSAITCGLYKGASRTSITLAASGTAHDCVHVVDGYYSVELTSTDTNTPGPLRVTFSDAANFLPVWENFTVLDSNIYDSLVDNSAALQVAVAANGLAAASIATGAITAAKFAAGAIDNAALATNAVQEIVDGILNEANASHVTTGTIGEAIRNAAAGTLRYNTMQAGSTSTSWILAAAEPSVDTHFDNCFVCIVAGIGSGQCRRVISYNGTTKACTVRASLGVDNTSKYIVIGGDQVGLSMTQALPSSPTANTVGEGLKRADGLPTDPASQSVVIAATNVITTALPPALVAGRMDSNMGSLVSSSIAAGRLKDSALGIVSSTFAAGTLSLTQGTTNLTETTNDHYAGRTIVFTGGQLAGQAATITAYNGSSKMLTFTAVTDLPENGAAFVIV